MKLAAPIIGILFWLTLAAPSVAEGDPQAHGSFAEIERWVAVFEDSSRKEWQKPLLVLDMLGVQPGDVVADLGAGTGYFTSLLSLKVGEEGKVYAVDIEQAMLDYIGTRTDTKQEQVIPVLADPDDPKLPQREVDLVLVVNTWHHIDKRPKYLRRLARSLSPEGRMVVIDFREGELPVGPPPGDKLSRQAVVQEFQKAGWTLVAESVALPYQYYLSFLPPQRRKASVLTD